MDILKGLLLINGTDVFTAYGAYLVEEKKGDNKNYSALLKPPAAKSHTAVSFRERDGEKLPDSLLPAWEARDVTLQFCDRGGRPGTIPVPLFVIPEISQGG